jgi:hypothetical protein
MAQADQTAGHTPGPWEVEPEDHISMGPCVTADGGREDGWIVCDLGLPTSLVGTCTEDINAKIIAEREANARLIAAAPEMLEVLEAVVASSPIEDSVLPIVLAVIAKAKGGAA